MTKEQIYEKISVITTGPNCIADMKVDAEKLSSYLATIEERLEKCPDCRAEQEFIVKCSKHTPTPTEVKDWEDEFLGLYESLGDYDVENLSRTIEDTDVRKIKSFIRKLLNK
jgi:hypothetical protein